MQPHRKIGEKVKRKLEENKIYLEYAAILFAFIGLISAYISLASQFENQNESEISQLKYKYYKNILLWQQYAQRLNCYYESTKDSTEYSADEVKEFSGYKIQVAENVTLFRDRLENVKYWNIDFTQNQEVIFYDFHYKTEKEYFSSVTKIRRRLAGSQLDRVLKICGG